jgi:hypothetical protein
MSALPESISAEMADDAERYELEDQKNGIISRWKTNHVPRSRGHRATVRKRFGVGWWGRGDGIDGKFDDETACRSVFSAELKTPRSSRFLFTQTKAWQLALCRQ